VVVVVVVVVVVLVVLVVIVVLVLVLGLGLGLVLGGVVDGAIHFVILIIVGFSAWKHCVDMQCIVQIWLKRITCYNALVGI